MKKSRKIIAWILTVIMLCSQIPLQTHAQENQVSQTLSDTVQTETQITDNGEPVETTEATETAETTSADESTAAPSVSEPSEPTESAAVPSVSEPSEPTESAAVPSASEPAETPETPTVSEPTETPEIPTVNEPTEIPKVPATGESAGIPEVPSAGEPTESAAVPSAANLDESALLNAVAAGGNVEVTRLEWLKTLTNVFQMSVEEDNYPDNYYSDIDASSADYYDIMLATEFGLVDVEAGDPLRPDEAATREFAAHTLNLCLGHLPDEGTGYTFSEASSVTYPDDIQIAINKGWLTLSDGNFLPGKDITAAEKDQMIAAAQTALNSTTISGSAGSQFQLAAGVIAIPEETEAALTDENEITLYDCSVQIVPGDIFVVVSGGLPIARRAVSVAAVDNRTVLTVEDVALEEAFVSLETQGSLEADLTQVQAIGDDVQLAYIVGGTQEQNYEDGITYYSLREVEDKEVTAVVATKTIAVPNEKSRASDPKLSDSLSISCKITNPSATWKISAADQTAYVNISADVTFSANFDATKFLTDKLKFDKPFVKVPIGLVGYFKPSVTGEISGKISLCQQGKISVGIYWNMQEGIRFEGNFQKKAFTIQTSVEAKIGVKAALGVSVGIVKAELYAEAGAKASVKKTTYKDSQLPHECIHIAAHLYAAFGGSVSIDLIVFKKTYKVEQTLLNEKNSPVKVALHYDDGVPVSICGRDSKAGGSGVDPDSGTGGYKYYTPIDSQYAFSGINSGTSSTGQPFMFFEYTLDKENKATITKYNGNVAALNIPETIDGYTVVGIGKDVFRNNKKIHLVTMPDTITEIKAGAFLGCSNLSDVTLSKNLTKLGGYAFGDCDSLTEITIPKSLKETTSEYYVSYLYNYHYGVFIASDNLKNITFEEGVTEIPCGLFANNNSIEKIVIPDTVTIIENNAFESCQSLAEIQLGTGLTSIGTDAFRNAKSLTKVEIPNSVTEIGAGAFLGCSNLSDVTLSKSLTKLGGYAFGDCDSLTEITIPKSLKETTSEYYVSYLYNYHYGVFIASDNLKNITFEEGVTEIPCGLFANNNSIEKIVIPDTVTIIEQSAFADCNNLKEIKLSSNLTTIGANAFSACTSLPEISIPDSVTDIGSSAFADCSALAKVKLPNALPDIASSLFQNCIRLTAIELPDSVTSIGGSAFQNTGLKKISLPENVTSIGANAFQDSTALAEVTMGDRVTTIGNYAFQNCDSLTAIRIPNSVTSLGTYCFAECELLKDVQLGTGLTKIGSYTFNLCPSLEKVVLPYRLNTVAANAFTNCTKLTQLVIPRTVQSIAGNSFSYPDRITVYGVSGTYAETWAKSVKATFVNQEKPATSVTLNESTVTVNKGSKATLVLTVSPSDFTDEITWKSSNTSVATVSDTGVVTTKGVGDAVIQVNVGNKSASCKVTVVQPVTSISLNKTSYSMEAESVYTLTATANPSTAKDRTITWSTSDKSVATVDANGKVTALQKGTAVITATANDGSNVSKSCTITVTNTVHNCVTATAMESPHNYENDCSDLWTYTLPGASQIAVTFDERTEIEDGFDYLYLYNASGTEIGKYTGKELAGQTVNIKGNTVKIKLVSDKSGNAWGFKVSKVETSQNMISGTIKFSTQGTAPVTVRLIDQNGTAVAQTALSNGNTDYGLGNVASGTYTLRMSKPGYVDRDYTVTVGTQPIELDGEIRLLGDVNGDGKINAMDKRILFNHIAAPALTGYEFKVGDVNNDGKINAVDKRMVYNHIMGTVPLW
ncbi:MAG: leucine-rich repeat protein [Clostridium sp.]|nr:leucine-rich repeat protein [Acetatifactor muris]MCM1527644.1 leucine-rich repeat protein [Bacteroides sp.]MCM1563660.1 leucine-rich repeat protein [Clostridium sp.]